jgi:hypothetical protein
MMNLQTIRTLWFVLRPVHECPAETVAQLDRAIGRALSVAKRFKLTSKCKAASAVVSPLLSAWTRAARPIRNRHGASFALCGVRINANRKGRDRQSARRFRLLH